MMPCRMLALTAAGCATFVGSAQAQVAPGPASAPSSVVTTGPGTQPQGIRNSNSNNPTPTQGVSVPVAPVAIRRLDLDIGGLVTYDTNAARANDQRAAANRLVQEDWIFSPSAIVDISVPFGRSVGYLRGTVAYDVYARNSRLNGERIILDGGVSTTVSRCTVGLDGEFARIRSNLGDIGVVVGDASLVRNFETTSTAGVTASCGDVVGIQPFVSGEYTRGTNTNRRRIGSDYETFTYGGGLRYVQPSIGEFGVVASFEDTDYTNRDDGSTDPILAGLESVPVRSFGAYYNRNVTRFFSGLIRANYTEVDTSANSRFSGLTGEASVRVTPSERLEFRAGVKRAAVPTLAFAIDYYVETSFNADVRTRITPKVQLGAGYLYRHHDYYSTTPNLLFPLIEDRDHQVQANASYDLGRRLALTLAAAYETRNARSSYYDFDSFRVTAGIRGSF